MLNLHDYNTSDICWLYSLWEKSLSKFTTVVKGIQNTFTIWLNYYSNHCVKIYHCSKRDSHHFYHVAKLWFKPLIIHHQGSNPEHYHQEMISAYSFWPNLNHIQLIYHTHHTPDATKSTWRIRTWTYQLLPKSDTYLYVEIVRKHITTIEICWNQTLDHHPNDHGMLSL